ncbi:MAG: hypothetical protein JXR79_04560 [Nitrospirae bacterium]|nr:hypothetical protein [Nitrospirota bacterium]
MRKLTVVAMAVLAVLAFAASVFAVQAEIPANTSAVVAKAKTQITLGGELAIRGRLYKNLDLESSNSMGDDALYQYQYILNLTAVTGKTKGVMELYSGQSGWVGFSSNSDGTSSFRGPVNGGDIMFRQLYLAFPVMGLNVSVGHQLGQLGVASFLDFSKEGADMILVSYPIDKKSSVALGTIKLDENGALGNDNIDQDANIYFATADIDLGGHMLGVNISRTADQSTALSGNELWNWGVTLKGKLMSNLSYVFAGDLQRGETSDNGNKYRGYHLRGVLNYQATSALGLKLASIYYSGEKGTATDGKVEGFQTYLEDKAYATFIYGYMIRGTVAANNPIAASTIGAGYGTGIPVPAGTWFNVLGANYKISKDLKAGLDFILLRGTYKNNANTNSKKIGWELDANIAYNLGDNLVYSVTAGMFDPGSAWARTNFPNDKNAYAFEHKITYKF